MYLIHMRPEQVQDAVRRNVPVVMPAGCVEYHGSHLPIGTDFLIANAVCTEAEKIHLHLPERRISSAFAEIAKFTGFQNG